MRFRQYFFTGLIILLPISLTAYISYKIFSYVLLAADYLVPSNFYSGQISIFVHLTPIVARILGYFLSVVTTFFLIIFAGVLTLNYFGRLIFEVIEKLILKVPFANVIYTTVKQISEMLFSKNNNTYKKVVMIEYPSKGLGSIGFLTNDNIGIGPEDNKEEYVTVFIPTSPNPTSGFLVLIERNRVVELNINVEDAVKLIISAGAIKPFNTKKIK